MTEIAYVNIFVSDLDRAIGFYESKLGSELRHADRDPLYLEEVGAGFPS